MERSILIAEDHPLLSTSIRSIFRAGNIEVVDEVQSCRAVIDALETKLFSHLILDITLSDGSSLPLLPKISVDFPSLKILIYSSHPQFLYSIKIWREFAIPFLSKSAAAQKTVEHLLDFINNKLNGAHALPDLDNNPLNALTATEMQVMDYLLEGMDLKEIATILNMDYSTARVHKGRINQKTATTNLIQLQKLAAIYYI